MCEPQPFDIEPLRWPEEVPLIAELPDPAHDPLPFQHYIVPSQPTISLKFPPEPHLFGGLKPITKQRMSRQPCVFSKFPSDVNPLREKNFPMPDFHMPQF